MPEKKENLEETEDKDQNSRANKCKKILKLFRNMRKENIKNQILENNFEKKGKKDKKKKFWDTEERKEAFKKNMENSWADLPNTLQRKKENISQDILSEYHDADSDESESAKTTSFANFGKKSKEKSYDLMTENNEATCEYFRQKKEDELDVVSLCKIKLIENESQKYVNYKGKKNLTSERILLGSEEAQKSLEKIRKLNADECDDRKPDKTEKKQDSYDLEAAVDEINLLFHDLIADDAEPNDATSSDSGNSEPYISLVFSPANKTNESLENCKLSSEIEENEKLKFRRSNSADSLLNESSASVSLASNLSQPETTQEKSKEVGFDLQYENGLEQNAEITYVNEVNEARSLSNSERRNCCKETLELLTKINKTEIKKNADDKEVTQYSDLIFPLITKSQSFFVNEHFNGDVTINFKNEEKLDSKELEGKVIYQELNFTKSDNGNGTNNLSENKENVAELEKEKFGNGKSEVENEISDQPAPVVLCSLSEEQKAKKKSAEAIAKELSSQVFSKKNQNAEECSNKNNVLTISIKCPSKTDIPNLENDKDDLQEEVCKENITTDPSREEEEENWKAERKNERFGGFLQYFSVADWRKAVALGSKRGISSVMMETIVEEPETDTSTKLSVREILRRFEELGNKHFNDRLCLTDDERTATLKQIHQTLKCLEEKVKNFENWNESNLQHQQYNVSPNDHSSGGWTGRGAPQKPAHSVPLRIQNENEEVAQTLINDGKHSLLQFAIHHFRQSPEKFEMLKASDGSISGSLKVIESKNKKNKEKGKGGAKDSSEWTWKEQVDLVKFTAKPIEQSLLQLDPELSDLAVECFLCLIRYMGDLPMPTDVSEVKCVYTILMHCHKYEQLRDEVYCQLMKQTTNNKSIHPESCQRGWRLFSIVAAYFTSSDTLKPFLFKYLETAAYDKRRAYHGTAMVCLQNLRKTFKYGGRKNVPSVEEITAISAGRNSKRQIYRLPGGTEKVVNTKSTTVVQDVIEELCVMINVTNPQEMEEFSVYCIVEGDTFTMPLAKEEYILDVTTELHKNHQVFYLIFCRSVWYFPLRLDSQLYVEVVFNQIAPDYLEGLLLILPGESLEQDVIYDISKIAALLHRAADMTEVPTMKETKFLLPKPALSVRDVKPSQWVNMVQSNWQDCENLTTIQAKAQVLDALSKWPLFGSSFFAVKKVSEPKDRIDHILALNKNGVHFIDLITHETLLHYPFSEVISTRKVKSEDGTLFLDMKCGNLMQQRITRLQTDQAHEISRLIRQYITMQQRMEANQI